MRSLRRLSARGVLLLALVGSLIGLQSIPAVAATANNLIVNGTFDTSAAPWVLGGTDGVHPLWVGGTNPHAQLASDTGQYIYQDFTLPAGGDPASDLMMSFTISEDLPDITSGYELASKPKVELDLADNTATSYFIEDVSDSWGRPSNQPQTFTFRVSRPNFPAKVARLKITSASCSGYIGTTLYETTTCNWLIDNVSLKAYPEISTQASMSFDGLQGGTSPAAQTLKVNNSGADGLTWSATTDKPWLKVTSTSASGAAVATSTAGLSPGTYTGNVVITSTNATNSPHSVPVSLVVHGPALAVSPTTLSFEGPVNGPNPPTQSLKVSNSGGGNLAWTASADQPWVTLAPASGTVPVLGSQSPTVTVNTQGLAAGRYSATITVRASGASNPLVTVPIALEVRGPTFVVTATNPVAFVAEVGGSSPAAQTTTVANTGGGSFGWTATDAQPWLTEAPASGTLGPVSNGPVSVSVNSSGLAVGTYESTITYSAPTLGSTRIVPVRLYVVPKGDITLNGGFEGATSIAPWVASGSVTNPSAGPGAAPRTGSKFLRMTGNGSAYQVVTVPKAATSADLGYALKIFTAETTTTAQKDRLQVLIRDASPASCNLSFVDNCPLLATLATDSNLEAGTTYGLAGPFSMLQWRGRSVVVELSVTDTAPDKLTTFDIDDVSLKVGTQDPPKLAAFPSILTFSGVAGAASPASQILNIGEVAGSTAIGWTASSNQPWLTLSATSGQVGPGLQKPDTVAVNAAGLAAGTYAATIALAATGATTVLVPVTLVVAPPPPPVVVTSPLRLSYSIPAGAASVTQTLGIGRSPTATMTWTASSNQPWLTVSAPSGSGSSVGATANPVGLAVGSYTGAIIVTGAGIGKPVTVPVTLRITTAGGTELVKNNGFEAGTAPWLTAGAMISSTGTAHAGTRYAVLGGTGTVSQPITIPKAATTADLTYWLRVNSTRTSDAGPRDTLKVELRNWSATCTTISATCGQSVLKTLETATDLDRSNSYQQRGALDLSAYHGQTVLLQFTANGSASTNFNLDDVSLLYGTTPITTLQVSPVTPAPNEDPGSLRFTGPVGTVAPPAQTLYIRNSSLPTAPITWTATDDMPWLTVGPASGTVATTASVSANPTGLTAGVYRGTITVSAPGATGSPAKVPVVLQVTSAGAEFIPNPGFDAETAPWAFTGAATWWPSGGGPHTGAGNIAVGGTDNATDSVYENVPIPSTATTANLSFYLKTTSAETSLATQYDTMYVELTDATGKVLTTLATFSNLGAAPVYSLKGAYNLLAYKGTTVRLRFRSVSDTSLPTTFSIDDLSLK